MALTWLKKASAVAVLAVMISAACVAVPLSEDREAQVADTSDAADVVDYTSNLVLASALATPIGGFIAMWLYNNNRGSASQDAEYLVGGINNLSKSQDQLNALIASCCGQMENFYCRQAEVAAAELWTKNSTMSYDAILLDGNASEQMAMLLQGIGSIYTENYNLGSDYANLKQSVTVGSVTLTPAYPDWCIVTVGCQVTGGSNDRVYLLNGGYGTDGTTWIDGKVYCSVVSTATGADGKIYQLAAGLNDLTQLKMPSGYYQLSAGTYAGSLMDSESSDAAKIVPTLILNKSTFVLDAGSVYTVVNGTTVSTASAVTFAATDADSTASTDVAQVFATMTALHTAAVEIQTKAVTAAAAAWRVYDTAGKASALVSPSALIPNLANMSFSADEVYLIYMTAMQQMSDYYATASGNFTAEDVLVSADSLDLVCHGTIYSDSTKATALASGYFTPMCYLRDQAIVVGSTVWQQTGLAMVWNVDDSGGLYAAQLVTLASGNDLVIDKMTYRNVEYTTTGDGVTLHVKSLVLLDGYDQEKQKDTAVSKVNWAALILYAAGIIAILAGAFTGRWDLIIGGIICIAVAYFAGAWIWSAIKNLGIIKVLP